MPYKGRSDPGHASFLWIFEPFTFWKWVTIKSINWKTSSFSDPSQSRRDYIFMEINIDRRNTTPSGSDIPSYSISINMGTRRTRILIYLFKKIFILKFNFEFLQKQSILFFKRLLFMMLFLILNIFNYVFQCGMAIWKCPKSLLPFEFISRKPLFIYKVVRWLFNFSH